jgi:aspartate racemase
VKAGRLAQGGALLQQAAQALIARGAQALVLACTEVPLVLEPAAVPAFDATQLLAEATVRWALRQPQPQRSSA